MKKTPLLLSISVFVLLASCTLSQKNTAPVPTPPEPNLVAPTEEKTTIKEVTTDKNNQPNTSATVAATKSFVLADVSKHNTGADCWLILDNKVYDVTSFIGKHPGGEAILKGCGKDATRMFSRHPESAKAMKEQFYIGDFKA